MSRSRDLNRKTRAFVATGSRWSASAAKRRHSAPLTLSIACLIVAACNDTRDLAPYSASTPWQTDVLQRDDGAVQVQKPPGRRSLGGSRVFAAPPSDGIPVSIQPAGLPTGHVYSLTELIDLAQTRNQGTRVSWEQARQAAIAVGTSRSTLLPQLTVDALGGYTHSALPFPTLLVKRGYITSDSEAIFPEAVVKYLLLDFGGREAGIEAAKQLSFAANTAFTAVHQKLILDVARAYFQLDGLNAQLSAAAVSLSNAQLLDVSAASRLTHGEGTVTDVAIARRGVAQAALAIAQARTAQHAAQLMLLALLDLPPETPLEVEDSSRRTLSHDTLRTLDTMMADALRQRPDLLLNLARLRASEAGIALARSDLLPTVSVAANVQGNIGQLSVDGGPYQSIKQPQAGVFLRFDWALYQGGAGNNRLLAAQSKRAEAEDSLHQSSTEAMREVALAYDTLQTGLTQYDAALVYEKTALTAFEAAASSFSHGVGTLTDATSAQTALSAARSTALQTHSQALVNAASLAFSAGSLTSALSPALTDAAP